MSATSHFKDFYDSFAKRLKKQTGLNMGQYTAVVLSGQNPSFKSDVFLFARKLQKRRKRGKKIKARDVDALLDMVADYMEYQELSGKDRVVFSRNVLTKVVPSLTATDLDTLSTGEITELTVTDELRDAVRDKLLNQI